MHQKYNCILLVDDDLLANYLSKRILDNLEVAERIAIANNGLEALNYIEACIKDKSEDCDPDLIFLDINMPVMTGIEFLESYKKLKNRNNAKIIMLTTSANEKDKARANSFNINGYLIKPLTKEKLNLFLEQE